MLDKLPDYAWLEGGGARAALRHVGGGEYFRDAGQWRLLAELQEGRVRVTSCYNTSLVGRELRPATHDEWAADNKGYV